LKSFFFHNEKGTYTPLLRKEGPGVVDLKANKDSHAKSKKDKETATVSPKQYDEMGDHSLE
jgi:hypothetical protein